MTTTTEHQAAKPQELAYRADIDGLRAVAIVVVVLYHAGVSLCSGGFVGVDVFFVISGWLITQQLLARSEASSGVRLLDFWARRIRRLVPAAVCMIVGTTVLSWLFLSPLEWRLISERGAAAALYVSNLLFARSAGNYFAGPLKTSPYLHTWSLSLEEQFYLFWPFVFVVASLVARRLAKPGFRQVLLGAMGFVLVVSLAINIRQTNAGSPWAFFGLPARAWEFALAGILAILVYGRAVVPRRAAEPLAVSGLVLVLYAVVSYDDATKFPGTAVLVPVIGTVLLLLAGHAQATSPDGRSSVVIRSLGWKPVVALGLLSYSWYLWHWPLMTIATEALSRDTVELRLAAAAVALVVAVASYRFIENPVRHSARLKASLGRTYALGAGLVVVALVFNGALYLRQRSAMQQEPYRTYEAARQSYSDTNCAGAVSPNGIAYCEAGATDSAKTVMLMGDSHAAQWMTALSAAATDLGIRTVLRSTGNCTATPDEYDTGAGGSSGSCAVYQRDTQALIDELRPAAVVLSDANHTKDTTFTDGPAAWQASTRRWVQALRDRGIAVGSVVDNPMSDDPLLCLARGHSESYCTPSYDDAMSLVDDYASGYDALGKLPGVATLDVNGRICRNGRCAIRVRDTWVFGAFEHLTQDFTLLQEPAVTSFLRRLTEASAAS